MPAKRSKPWLRPITLEELDNSTAISGLESMLRFETVPFPAAPPVSTPVETPVSTPVESRVSTPVNTVPPLSTPVETVPPVSTPVDTIKHQQSIVSTPVETVLSTPVDTVPVPTPVDTTRTVSTPVNTVLQAVGQHLFLSKLNKRLFSPRRPSDAHTDGEDRLYQFMWEHGERHASGVRLCSVSIGTLAGAIGRIDRNVRPVVESLIRKLSIAIAREMDQSTRRPRVYFVFDYSEITARRKRAGLEWALKNKGIQLLSAAAAADLVSEEARPVDGIRIVSTGVNTVAATVSTPVERVVSTPVERVLSTPVETGGSSKWRSCSEKEAEETTTTLVVAALRDAVGYSDDDAVRSIVNACREMRPDAAGREIEYFIRFHGKNARQAQKPMGFLIRQVPRCFEGESFRQFRELECQRREAEQRRQEELQAEGKRVLEDPASSDEDREWARTMIEGNL